MENQENLKLPRQTQITETPDITNVVLIQGLYVVMAMATSATELPDKEYDNSNNLVNYHQPEEGNLAYNLDHSVPTYKWDYIVPSASSQHQLLNRFHKKYPITSHGALSLHPTMGFSRTFHSTKIKSDVISQGDNASGHDILKRSPLVPEDPFLVGGTKSVKSSPVALPLIKYKKWKAKTGPLIKNGCNSLLFFGTLGLTTFVGPKFCKPLLPLG